MASLADVPSKITFAFQVFDLECTGRISARNMIRVLVGINNCASYFGDAVVSRKDIEELVIRDVFQSPSDDSDTVEYTKHVAEINSHPLVTQFVSGLGTVRYNAAKK